MTEKNNQLIDLFIRDNKHRLAERTLSSYAHSIKRLFQDVNKEYRDVKWIDIEDWMGKLANDGLKSNSISTIIMGLRQFFKYCLEENLITVSPMDDVELPPKEDYKIRFIDGETLEKLRNRVKDNLRDRALIEFMYSTGVRSSEVANLQRSNINFDEKLVTIFKGKGKKDRIIPFTEVCKVKLMEYLKDRKDNLPNLFLNYKGNPLKKRTLERYFEDYSKRIGYKITPKTLRHTFASHLFQRGMPLVHIQELMGHDSISTTIGYAKLTDRERKIKRDQY